MERVAVRNTVVGSRSRKPRERRWKEGKKREKASRERFLLRLRLNNSTGNRREVAPFPSPSDEGRRVIFHYSFYVSRFRV